MKLSLNAIKIVFVAISLIMPVSTWAAEDDEKTKEIEGLPLSPEDKQRAEKLYVEKHCEECHGKEGSDAIKNYPNLAGQSEKYLRMQIQDIISGERSGGNDETGKPRSENMKHALLDENGKAVVNEEEIDLLVKWLTNLKPVGVSRPEEGVSKERYEKGKELYKSKRCDICHGRMGMRPKKGYPYIANQRKSYIEAQINDMRDKLRRNGHARRMSPFVKNITDEEVSLIADYLAHTSLRKPRVKRDAPEVETTPTEDKTQD